MRPPRRRRADAAREADAALLIRRLRRLGAAEFRTVHVHENRTVLVSVGKGRVLRVHRGYAYATDRVLHAIVRFVHPRATAAERRQAEQVLVAFPVERYVPRRSAIRRREPPRPGDRAIVAELERRHRRLNERYFGGRLGPVHFRVSDRMRTSLGELEVHPLGRWRLEIAISRRHLARDGWAEVEETLLHEMVHQWQVESRCEPDHGESFKRKAREVGIAPGARRSVGDVKRR